MANPRVMPSMSRPLALPALLTFLLALVATVLPGAPAGAVPPHDGAAYREFYFPMADGTMLHADVLRDPDVAWDVVQPVIMVVSPYASHSGSTTAEAGLLVTGGDGPNTRFNDFLELSGALEQGYTYALVDLPGFGGSGGCNDWGGLREQGGVAAAVEWGASVDFATGRTQPTVRQPVGLLGKSYDGWTGLMAMAQDTFGDGVDGLAAVVSLEPVFSGYRYLYNNGVPLPNASLLGTITGFQHYDAKPGAVNDDPEYQLNQLLGGTPYTCYVENIQGSQEDREDAPYWVERDLLRLARGSDVPLFLTQGFLETNTKVDAALDFWNGLDHSAGHNRAWFGQFNHVRGWDRVGGPLGQGELETGKADFIEQMMEFYDEHLKGIAPQTERPAVEVQSSTGEYRGEDSYPPADMTMLTTDLGIMDFMDVTNNGDGPGSGKGAWRVSQVLPTGVHMAGDPVLTAGIDLMGAQAPYDYAANIYDIDEDGGVATLVSRATMLVRDDGPRFIDLQMYGQDWVFEEGHRIGVLLSGGNEDWWNHSDTGAAILAEGVEIALPLLPAVRDGDLVSNGTTPRLRQHRSTGTIPLSAVDLDDQVDFTLPGAAVEG